MSNENETLLAIDEAVADHHREVYKDDTPTTVIGWVVGYTAVDGNGYEVTNYAVGRGAPLPLAVGILELTKTTLTSMAVAAHDDDEDEL